jgi:acid stress chaperone HdeB
MPVKILSALFVTAALCTAAPGSAQKLDLSTIKCKDFIESSKENIGLILMWLDGYYTDEDDPPVVDFDKMKTNGEKLGAYCVQNPTIGLMTAAEGIMAK